MNTKNQTQGRQDLLTWINEFTECDYPRVEMLSDGIAYSQIMDALHPGCIHLRLLNFNCRFPDEYTRNLKIDKTVPIDKLSKAKFQDNMNFLQWLFNYSSKIGPFAAKSYKGYQKRQEAFEKQQHGKYSQMSAHLIPNTEFLKFRSGIDLDNQSQFNKSDNFVMTKTKAQLIDEVAKDLEQDLKNKMEYNWKLVYALDDMVYQRNVLFNLLSKIEKCVSSSTEQTITATKISNIIKETPIDFAEIK